MLHSFGCGGSQVRRIGGSLAVAIAVMIGATGAAIESAQAQGTAGTPAQRVVNLSRDSALTAPAPANDGSVAKRTAPSLVGVTAADASACGDGRVCFWSSTNYQGSTKVVADCTEFGGRGWFYILGAGLYFNSAKNRCASRKVELGTALIVTKCLNAGGEDPSIADSDRFKIGISNSNC